MASTLNAVSPSIPHFADLSGSYMRTISEKHFLFISNGQLAQCFIGTLSRLSK